MTDIDRLCDRCADRGVTAVVTQLPNRDAVESLARACLDRAGRERTAGDATRADRLVAAAQYLNYLVLTYD